MAGQAAGARERLPVVVNGRRRRWEMQTMMSGGGSDGRVLSVQLVLPILLLDERRASANPFADLHRLDARVRAAGWLDASRGGQLQRHANNLHLEAEGVRGSLACGRGLRRFGHTLYEKSSTGGWTESLNQDDPCGPSVAVSEAEAPSRCSARETRRGGRAETRSRQVRWRFFGNGIY